MKIALASLALVFTLTSTAPAAGAGAPIPVSPGAPDRFVGVGSPCPTFSWSAVEGATGYEVVVYRAALPEEAFPGSADPVLRARIPAGALAWTPAAEQCLDLAGSYAWLVRAAGLSQAGWSSSHLFRVDVDAVLGEMAPVLKRAIEAELRGRGLPAGEPAVGGLEARSADGAAEPAMESPAAAAAFAPEPRGVFGDDVELWLQEAGSGLADRVQLVFATPEYDGDAINGDAWSITVGAYDGGSTDGTMTFSTPTFVDALQLFVDGTALVGAQRYVQLKKGVSPPFTCTAGQEGSFYWDDTDNAMCVCDGSSWAPVDSDNPGTCF